MPSHTERVAELPPKVGALLDAVMAISSDLDLHSVLTRIVKSACQLTEAQYGALGVLGRDGGLADFVTHGLSDAKREHIGTLPHGLGILGEVIERPRPLRLISIQDHPRSHGFPAHHRPMRTFLGVPVRIRGTVFGNLYVTEKADQARFTADDEWVLDALASAAGLVIERAQLYVQSERRRRWLEASAEITELLQPPLLPAAALGEIAAYARRVSGASLVAVVHDVDGPDMGIGAVEQSGDDASVGRRSLQAMVAGYVPLVHDAVQRNEVIVASRLPQVVLLVPLRSPLADHGVLFVVFARERLVEPEEVELLAAFADQGTLALDRAQAVSDRAELAVLTDRDRIARDLHDLVIQRLFATGLQLQGASRIAATPDLRERIERAVTDLDFTVRDIRSTIFDLHYQQSTSLPADMHALIEEYTSTLGFAPRIHLSGPVDLAAQDETRQQLSAVLREALSNIARHAKATHAVVELVVDPAEVIMRVTDDGIGPGTGDRESGLRNVRARAEERGGSVSVTRSEPHATQLEWRVPR